MDKNNGLTKHWLFLIARFCLATLFIMSGLAKWGNISGVEAYMASKGMPFTAFFLHAAALIEVVGGVFILLGYHFRWSATVLLFYVLAATLIFHNFWAVPASEMQTEIINFLKNLGILGALFYSIAAGPGRFSLDAKCCCKE